MNFKFLMAILLTLGYVKELYAQTNFYKNSNSVKVDVIHKTGVKSISDIELLNLYEKSSSIQYGDGLGRKFYESEIAASPFRRDITTINVLNGMQVSDTFYLPFVSRTVNGELLAKNAAIDDLMNFYSETRNKVVDDNHPYSVIKYDASPANTVLEEGKPGFDWQPGRHTKKFKVYTNLNNQFKIWQSDLNAQGFYPAGSLRIQEIIDEDGNITKYVVDSENKLIEIHKQTDGIIFARTLYIYNKLGLVRYIVQPEGVNRIGNANTISQSIIENFSIQFKYDSKARLVEKHVSGSGVISYIYDLNDRVILAQDENNRQRGSWLFTKIDFYGRVIQHGLFYSNVSRESLQNQVNEFFANGGLYFEERIKVGINNYTNQSFPTQNTEIFGINFYDSDFDLDNNNVSDSPFLNVDDSIRSLVVKEFGLLSASKVKIIGTNDWLIKYYCYDKYGRILAVKYNSQIDLNYFNSINYKYDEFSNLRNLRKSHKNKDGSIVTLLYRYEYDHAKRLLNVWNKINNQSEVKIINYVYNELGQVVKKNIHYQGAPEINNNGLDLYQSSEISRSIYYSNERNLVGRNLVQLLPGYAVNSNAGQTLSASINVQSYEASVANGYSQSIDYNYTIHGTLSGINSDKDVNDLFSEELFFNSNNYNFDIEGKWNGLISGVKTSSIGLGNTDNFRSYQYDNSNQLKSVEYVSSNEAGLWNSEVDAYNEKFEYDLNGNIKKLVRNTLKYNINSPVPSYSSIQLDSLDYTYNNGNLLVNVVDKSTNQAGFKNHASGGNNFSYNSFGSLTSYKSKNIQKISYNHIGLVDSLKFFDGKLITYTYSGDGEKLSIKVTQGTSIIKRSFVGEFIYKNDSLEYFTIPDGRAVVNGNEFKYEYFILDHIGNNRVVFSADNSVEHVYKADFENSSNNQFINYNNRVGFNLMDKTDAGTTFTYTQKLTGGHNSQVGLSKSLKVYPGDKIEIKAFAKYLSSNQTTNLIGFAGALTQAFGLSSTSVGEAAKAYQAINEYGGFIASGNGEGNSSHPKAFINILVYDKDFNFLDLAFEQVQGGEQQIGGPNTPHDEMNINYQVKKEGYIFFFISYEDTRSFEVYFDDIELSVKESKILQYNEYYAHGMRTKNSWTRERVTSNNLLINGMTDFSFETDLNETAFRTFDPMIGRFLQIDPLAHVTPNLNPYHFGMNNPVMFNDPTGLITNPGFDKDVWKLIVASWEGVPDGAIGQFNFINGKEVSSAWAMFISDGNGMGSGGGFIGSYSDNFLIPGIKVDAATLYSIIATEAASNAVKPGSKKNIVIGYGIMPNLASGVDFAGNIYTYFYDPNSGKSKTTLSWVAPIETKKDRTQGSGTGDGRGSATSFSFGFAFGFGMSGEWGIVTDETGASKGYWTVSANFGLGLDLGFNKKEIIPKDGSRFRVDQYAGKGKNLSAGAFFTGESRGGNTDNDFNGFGVDYKERSNSLSPLFGIPIPSGIGDIGILYQLSKTSFYK